MARKPRLILPNVPYHLVQRGNNKQNVFYSDADKDYYMKCVQKYRKQFDIKLFAWCLMDNHVHFVMESKDPHSFGLFFKQLNVKYSHYIKKKQSFHGQLWQGRYYSCALDDAHFIKAIQYVELNPIRAKIEDSLGEYYWSSFHERLKKRSKYYLHSNQLIEWVGNWNDFIISGLDSVKDFDLIRRQTRKNHAVGNDFFMEGFERKRDNR